MTNFQGILFQNEQPEVFILYLLVFTRAFTGRYVAEFLISRPVQKHPLKAEGSKSRSYRQINSRI